MVEVIQEKLRERMREKNTNDRGILDACVREGRRNGNGDKNGRYVGKSVEPATRKSKKKKTKTKLLDIEINKWAWYSDK